MWRRRESVGLVSVFIDREIGENYAVGRCKVKIRSGSLVLVGPINNQSDGGLIFSSD